MEIFSNQTPTKTLKKSDQNIICLQDNSSNHSIKRINSLIPSSIFKTSQNNCDNSHKESISIKKSCKLNRSKINKIQKIEENKNDSFSNFVNNIYTKESHLNKNIIEKSPRKKNDRIKKNYVSNKTLYNSQSRRMSAINSHLGLSEFNKGKNTNINNFNVNTNKEGLTINSNYKSPVINKKLCQKIDNLLHKKNLTKKEKEIILNFFNKNKDCDSSPKHRMYNRNAKSPKLKNGQRKNNKSKFIKKDNPIENEKTEKDNKNENEGINNIILYELKDNKTKVIWFKNLLCCLETE